MPRHNIRDYTGLTIGFLTIIGESETKLYGVRSWDCICKCGKKSIRRTGHITNCIEKGIAGCRKCVYTLNTGLNKEPPPNKYKDRKVAKIKRRARSLESQAKRKKGVFELDQETVEFFVVSPCHYCGLVRDNLNGIDRVDNSLPYLKSNCVPCCTICNTMKSTFTTEEFFKHIEVIYDKNFR